MEKTIKLIGDEETILRQLDGLTLTDIGYEEVVDNEKIVGLVSDWFNEYNVMSESDWSNILSESGEEISNSCDECHREMSESDYKRNKGLCDVCIDQIQ